MRTFCGACIDVILFLVTEQECIKEHEQSMEAAFAAQLSEDKTCGICHEVVWEKQSIAGRRFGILSDCSHIFCLACIRQWRSADQYDSEVIRYAANLIVSKVLLS